MSPEPETSSLPLPDFVDWSIFPFEGDLRVRQPKPPFPTDRPRAGEPGGIPCPACAAADDEYIWADERWRVLAARPSGVPVQVFLETREHVDMDDLDDEMAGELGRMTVRLDRAIQAVGGIGRVHVARWGDGGSHFHMWFYGRPRGASQMLGFCLPMWAQILPPTEEEVWRANMAVVAAELAKVSGAAIATP
jgi:diadenosine tetraphosphate (Ap4A) HIT family hydrolase